MEDIKIVLLKSNHHIITKINEIRTEDETPICFLLEAPLVVSYTKDDNDGELKVSFSQLMPFSKTTSYRIPFNQVITIGEPKDFILKKYIELVEPYYSITNNAEPNKTIEGEESND